MNGFRTRSFRSNQSNPPQTIQIKVTENDICGYISLLEQMKNEYIKNNSEIIAKIDLDCSENRMKTALLFSEILLRLGVDNSIIKLSLKWLCKIFTSQPSVSQNDILLEWIACDPKTKEKIKSAIFKGLSFNDPQILSLTSLALSSLLSIEKTQSNIIKKLYEIYEYPSSSNLTKSAAINVLAEICREKPLNGYSEPNDPLNNITKKIYEKIIEYFTSDITTRTIDIRFNLTAAIDTFVEPELIKKNINKVKKSVIDNLQNIPANKPANSIAYPEQLHYKLLSVLFKIICLIYNSKDVNSHKVIYDLLKQIKRRGINHDMIEQLKENGVDEDLIAVFLGGNYKPKILIKLMKHGLNVNFLKNACRFPIHFWRHIYHKGEVDELKEHMTFNINNYDDDDNYIDIENEFRIFENIIGIENGSDDDDSNEDSYDDSNTESDDDDDTNNDNDNNNNDDNDDKNDIESTINGSFNLILKQILEFNASETNQFIIE